MDVVVTLAVLSGIIFLGFIAEQIFRKYDIPDVLLLIGVGIGISTILGWQNGQDLGEGTSLFTTFALIFILFQGALYIDFKTLVKSLPKTFALTVLSFLLTFAAGTAISYLLGYSLPIATLIGAILGGTSSAVVIPLVQSVEIREKYGLVLKLESALSDVLAIVTTVTVLQVIQSGNLIASAVFRSILSSFSLALIVGTLVGFAWMFLQSRIEVLSRAYMLTIAAVIGLYAFVESPFVQASGAIAALAFGLVLGNSRSILKRKADELNGNKKKKKTQKEEQPKIITNILTPTAKNFYDEISFFVKTFFFVYLGMLIDFSNPFIFVYGAILTLAFFLVRPLAVALVFRNDGFMERKERVLVEVLIPKGLAAAVLAGLSVQTGVIGAKAGEFTTTILSVILLSILMTSILVFLTEKNLFKGILPFFHTKKENK